MRWTRRSGADGWHGAPRPRRVASSLFEGVDGVVARFALQFGGTDPTRAVASRLNDLQAIVG
jgi:hypothetical protein